ncbi:lysozyme inhibitor LprI family protein [Erythrobacter sp. YT30]|uniref:lysozyme inhibitor LprI family protein n=1 Tax=Erythrobacter sp. YT30 TaxID=1735012 RepID=UPI000AB84E8B|nr:lysozyme inhibitor LprI family protein [Erythrobacter sp. YT30]
MIAELILLLMAPSAETYNPECNQEAADRGIQQEMNICAHRDYLLADEKLNAQWKLTSATMKERDESWNSDWDERPGYFASLLEAQRAWIAFRDAHCRVDGYTARGGSLEPLLVSTCKTALTEARTEQLKNLADGPA